MGANAIRKVSVSSCTPSFKWTGGRRITYMTFTSTRGSIQPIEIASESDIEQVLRACEKARKEITTKAQDRAEQQEQQR